MKDNNELRMSLNIMGTVLQQILHFHCLMAVISPLTSQFGRGPILPIGFQEESIFGPLVWNASSWEEYIAESHCGRTCQNDTLVERWLCRDPACFDCDCDEDCSFLGTCCIHFDTTTNKYSYNIETSLDKNPNQWYKMIRCEAPLHSLHDEENTLLTRDFLTVSQCPDSWQDQQIRTKCENMDPQNFSSLDEVPIVSHRKTKLVFRNIYCAKCNRIDYLEVKYNATNNRYYYDETGSTDIAEVWRIRISCDHYQHLYDITDPLEFYQRAVELSECVVDFSHPNSPKLRRCEPGHTIKTPPEKYCNWVDPEIEHLCHGLPSYLSLTVVGYKNLFCSYCNATTVWFTCSTSRGGIQGYEVIAPTMFLFSKLRYRLKTVKKKRKECPAGHWLNDENTCEEASCSPGKLLEGESCKTQIPDVKGLGYNIRLRLGFLNDIPQRTINKDLDTALRRVFKQFPGETIIRSRYIEKYCPAKDNEFLYKKSIDVELFGRAIAPFQMTRDEYENKVTSVLFTNKLEFNFTLYENKPSINFTLGVHSIGEEEEKVDSRSTLSINRMAGGIQISGEDPFCVTRSYSFENSDSPSKLVSSSQQYNRADIIRKLDDDSRLDFNPTLTCPFVALNITSIRKTKNGSVFTVLFRGKETEIVQSGRIYMKDGRLKVCLSFIKNMINDAFNAKIAMTPGKYPDIMKTLYAVHISCTSISVVCLLTTLSTYILFPSLRSIPGKNNMALCLSLLVIQLTFLVSFGVKATEGNWSKVACIAESFISHYSWLLSFFWMNVCCIHMFRVFRSATRTGSWSQNKVFLYYCIYAVGTPLIIVATHVILSYTTQGGVLGYSDVSCNIDFERSTFVATLTVLVPICGTIFINTGLFLYTVYNIVAVKRLQKQTNRNKSGMITYIKLSTVTGGFFIFTILASFYDSIYLWFFTCPLSGLIGFYVFIAFTCNSHVVNLYKSLFRSKPMDNNTAAPNQITISTTATRY